MRLTRVLFKQNIYWHSKMQWRLKRHRTIENDGAIDNLKNHGKEVVNAVEAFIKQPPMPDPPKEIADPIPFDQLNRDETHPWWNSRVCHLFGDANVLICGKKQAQNLTKTLVANELPENLQKRVNNIEITETTDIQLKNSILQAHLYDAHQEKLAIKKHPVKLMWVFKRDWGITDQRKNRYITDKLIQYCEKLSNPTISSERKPLENARFVVPFEKDGNHFQFDKTAETFILSKKPIAAIDGAPTFESDEVPDLSPLSSNIGIDKENIYKIENVYPVANGANFEHPHTAFIHYTPLNVFNYTLEPVTEDQIESRALLKAFTFAAAKAQSVYGANVRDLPKPITIQCIHVHVNKFYFGVYQLNTLNLDGSDGNKNYWFSIPPMLLYSNCEYRESRPVLMDYNNDVLRHALAFYQS